VDDGEANRKTIEANVKTQNGNEGKVIVLMLLKFYGLFEFTLLSFFFFSGMSTRAWLISIGLEKEAEEYGRLLEHQKYFSLADLLEDPPSKEDLKEDGITARRDINRIMNGLKVTNETGIDLLNITCLFHQPKALVMAEFIIFQ